MRSNRERDAEMDRLLRAVMAEGPAAAEGCPAADDLAAYAERTLPDGERPAMEGHLAACARCQEALALLIALPEGARPPAVLPEAPPWWRAGWKRWLVPLGAVASAVVLYVAVKPDETLRSTLPSGQSIVSPAPAQLPASPESAAEPQARVAAERGMPAKAERPDVEAGRPSAAAPSGTANAPSGGEPPARRETPGRKLEAAEGKLAATEERRAFKAEPEQAIPPAVAQDAARPAVPVLVGARLPPPPPPPPAPTEARPKAQQPPPVVGGVMARPEARQLAAEQPPGGAGKPGAESVIVMAEAPTADRTLATRRILVTAAAAQVRWSLGPGARIFGSTDAGKTWHLQYSGERPLAAGSAPSRTTCWVVGATGLVLRTADGATWEARAFPEGIDLVAVTATDEWRAVVTARDGRRFSTEDGGATWSPARQD